MTDIEQQLVRERLAGLIDTLQRAPRPKEQAWGATFDAGLSRVHYPEGWGGLGVRAELQSVVDEALDRIGIPPNFPASPGAIGIVAPVLATFASDDQRRRHLRNVFTCEEYWCQLFSEPDAGSDLPGLRSRAVRDGDSWILNGHKVWTTMGHIAQFGLLLARTSDQPRHLGITCFILDMSSPGVEVRPLRQMTGEAEFNEVFFTDVVIPDSCRLGNVDDGWRIAIGTLMEERNAVNYVYDNEVPAIEHAIALWRSLPCEARTLVRRDRLADLFVQSTVYTHMRARGLAKQKTGTPGPEGSLAKLRGGELNQLVYELCVELLGADGMLWDTYEMRQPRTWYEFGVMPSDLRRAFVRSRANTIEGGTNEIQRNIIAERVLGLPREPTC
jgi:alkylation response protein AidB-like acyl-CoA dehydrogenase